MLTETTKEQIKDIVSDYCFKDKENELYYSEIYTTDQDKLSDETLKKILSSETPRDAFYETINDYYMESGWEYENNLMKNIIKNEEIATAIYKEEFSEDEILDYLREIHFVQYPHKHFLDQDICVNIILDTGDANYDFTLNNAFASWEGKDETTIHDCSSLLWLAKQQGYSKSQLTAALKDLEFGASKFLKSVYQEVANTSSGLNALVFMIQLELRTLLELKEAIAFEKEKNKSYYPKERKGRGYLILSKDVSCGLYDSWNGAGGVLEIALEKKLRLPFRLIHSTDIDGIQRNSIKNIWGICSSAWSDHVIKGIHSMKKTA